MPPPKDMPVIEEPEVISEIRTDEEEKQRRPTITQHMRSGSFASICSKKPSFTARKKSL